MYPTREEEAAVREFKELLEAQSISTRDWQKVTHITAKREADSPVGPEELECHPCGHGWNDHDDDGCLWNLCSCGLPGERK